MTPYAAGAETNPDLVTPGVWGFVITFAVAVVIVLLIMDMVRRIRRVRYRDDIARKLDAEQHEPNVQQHDANGDAGAVDKREPRPHPRP